MNSATVPEDLSHTQETPTVTALPFENTRQPSSQTPRNGGVAEFKKPEARVTNPRATLARYRGVTVLEWSEILEQYKRGLWVSRSSSGKAFNRAEVALILERYGKAV